MYCRLGQSSSSITGVQAPGPTHWMYINVILERANLLVPLHTHEAAPLRVLNRQHRERQREIQRQTEPGLLFAWKTLRQASPSPMLCINQSD